MEDASKQKLRTGSNSAYVGVPGSNRMRTVILMTLPAFKLSELFFMVAIVVCYCAAAIFSREETIAAYASSA